MWKEILILADPEEATSKSGSAKEISEMGAFAVSKLVVIEQSEPGGKEIVMGGWIMSSSRIDGRKKG